MTTTPLTLTRTKEVVTTMALVPSVRRLILHKNELSPRSELKKLFPEGAHRIDIFSWQMSPQSPEEAAGEATLVIFIADVFYGNRVVDRETTIPFLLTNKQS